MKTLVIIFIVLAAALALFNIGYLIYDSVKSGGTGTDSSGGSSAE